MYHRKRFLVVALHTPFQIFLLIREIYKSQKEYINGEQAMWKSILKNNELPEDWTEVQEAYDIKMFDREEGGDEIENIEITLRPEGKLITIKEAIELGIQPIPRSHIPYLGEMEQEKEKEIMGLKVPGASIPLLSYETTTKTWFNEKIPHERAMYNMLSSIVSGKGDEAQWIIFPNKIGSQSGIAGPNYSGLIWLTSENLEDTFVFSLNWEGSIHRDNQSICVYVRGNVLPFEQYKFAKIEEKEVEEEEQQRPSGFLTRRLGITATPKVIEEDDEGNEAELNRQRGKAVYDFLTSMEETSKGPAYGDRTSLPRWAKVSIALGSSTPRSTCINLPRQVDMPRGDIYGTGLLAYWSNLEFFRTHYQLPRPAANTYPLENALIQLEERFGKWDPNKPTAVFNFLEENNYLLGEPPNVKLWL